MAKIEVSVTIDKKFLDWIDKMVEDRTFANRSHAFEYALKRLMEEKTKGN